jgi:trigger factor
MNVKMEKIADSKVKLTVTLDAETFNEALKKAYETVVKDVKIDGFRQGKVPFSIFINRFGYEALYEEGVNVAINDNYPKAVVENNIEVVAQPEIDFDPKTIGHDKEFTFVATVDVVPPVLLGEYFGTKVKVLSKEVTEADVNREVDKMLKGKAENIIKEDAVAVGDTAVIDFEGFVGDKAFEGGKGENYPLEIGSGSFIPGFEEQLVGLKSGDKKDVLVTFPAEYQAKDLAGKEAKFVVTVHEVKTKAVPELTDDLIKDLKIENVNTVAEYKEYLTKNLKEQKERDSENNFVDQLLKTACDNARVDIPKSMVDHEMEHRMEEVENQAKQYNLPLETFLQYNGLELEAFKKDLEKVCHGRVLEELVINAIADKEKVEVTEEDINEEFTKIANAYKMELSKVKEMLPKEQIIPHLRQLKTINLLKEKAIIE